MELMEHKEEKPKVPLCDEQREALQCVLRGFDDLRPIILTGRAGSGKSQVIKALDQDHHGIATLTATTGRAALLIGGITVDRLFMFSRSTWQIRNLGRLFDIMTNIPRIVVVDEASMAGEKMFQILYDVCLEYKKQLVLVGDWAQAKTVKDKWPFDLASFQAAHVIKLQECHRQADQAYLNALEHVRHGMLTQEVVDVFWPRVQAMDEDTHDEVVRMYATNAKVDDYNDRRLTAHCEAEQLTPVELWSSVYDARDYSLRVKYPMTDEQKERHLDAAITAHGEPLAVGCRVMITMNGSGYVNGDTGDLEDIWYCDQGITEQEQDDITITGRPPMKLSLLTKDNLGLLDKMMPLVAWVNLDRSYSTERGGARIRVGVRAITQEVKKAGGGVEAKIRGIPIRLGYAMTIHKSQGTTVGKAHVDMLSLRGMPEGGRHGLAYVAMSRTTTLEGLTISGLDHDMLQCDEVVRASGLL